MILILGLFIGAMIAGIAYLIGYGAGHTNGFLTREQETGDAFASDPLRAPTAKELTATVVREIDRTKSATFGLNGARAGALEVI